MDVTQCAEEVGFAFSSLKAVGLESATQGESLAKIDHHDFEDQKLEFDNPRSRNPMFELVTCDLLSSGVSEAFVGERTSLVLIRTGSYFRPLPLCLHSFNTSILRVFVCGPELDLQGTQKSKRKVRVVAQ